jgi:hypothetical protein
MDALARPAIPHIGTLLLSAGFLYRHLSETRVAVCLILGPVFVLWF